MRTKFIERKVLSISNGNVTEMSTKWRYISVSSCIERSIWNFSEIIRGCIISRLWEGSNVQWRLWMVKLNKFDLALRNFNVNSRNFIDAQQLAFVEMWGSNLMSIQHILSGDVRRSLDLMIKLMIGGIVDDRDILAIAVVPLLKMDNWPSDNH